MNTRLKTKQKVAKTKILYLILTGMFLVFGGASPGFADWEVSMHGGYTIPRTVININYDNSYMFGIDFGYNFSKHLSAFGFVGFNHFKAKPTYPNDTHWINCSANLKWENGNRPLAWYVNGGVGMYFPKSGPAKPGFNAGIGIDRWFGSHLAVELGMDYHHIITKYKDPEFFTLHVGLLYRF